MRRSTATFHWRFYQIDRERDRSVYRTCADDEATVARILMVIVDAEQDAFRRGVEVGRERARSEIRSVLGIN